MIPYLIYFGSNLQATVIGETSEGQTTPAPSYGDIVYYKPYHGLNGFDGGAGIRY